MDSILISKSLIVAMWVFAALMIILPIAVLKYFDGRVDFTVSAIFLGIVVYAGFDIILLSAFDGLILNNFSVQVHDFIYADPTRYTIYYSFIHALFYSAGFFTVARMSYRVDANGAGIAIGAGAGGARLIHNAWTMISNAITSAKVNEIGIEEYISGATESEIAGLRQNITAIANSSVGEIALSGLENILMFSILFCMGVLIHLGATHRGPIWLVYVGMAIMFAVFAAPALYTCGLITNMLVLEISMTVIAIATITVTLPMSKKYMNNPLKY